MNPNQVEIMDEDLRTALMEYPYVMPPDRIRVTFEQKHVKPIEGVLLSLSPAFMVQTDADELYSIKMDKTVHIQLIKRASIDERLASIKKLRADYRNFALLDACAKGSAILVSERPEEGGECQ